MIIANIDFTDKTPHQANHCFRRLVFTENEIKAATRYLSERDNTKYTLHTIIDGVDGSIKLQIFEA